MSTYPLVSKLNIQTWLFSSPSLVIHHLIGLVLFTIYGIAVCPFLEDLNRINLIREVSLVFAVIILVQIYLGSQQRSVKQVFIHSLVAFSAGGLLLAIGNSLMYGFPVDSGFKVMLGMVLLGLFISADLALCEQLKQSIERVNNGGEATTDKSHSLVMVIQISALTLITTVVTVFLLMIIKDLTWLSTIGESLKFEDAFAAILLETAFLFIVSIAYASKIIYSFSQNLQLTFNNQIAVLDEVSRGARDSRIPVIRNDELGIIAQYTNTMITTLKDKEQEVLQTRDVAILGLASLAEARDNETGAHLLRTQRYVKALAEQLALDSKYAHQLDPVTIDALFKSAPLHDVGKVGIPDNILLKPGKLSDEEFAIMKGHAAIGANALRNAEADLDQNVSNPFLKFAAQIAESHHEKWDGSGYPKGLAGEDIPIAARLMALADVYDALICERVYKPAFPHAKAAEVILNGRGSHFDPTLVDAFKACEQRFIDISLEFKDN